MSGRENLKPCKQCGVLPDLMRSHGFRFDMVGMVYKYTCPRCGRNTKAYHDPFEAFNQWQEDQRQ